MHRAEMASLWNEKAADKEKTKQAGEKLFAELLKLKTFSEGLEKTLNDKQQELEAAQAEIVALKQQIEQ
ncbi:unnamed protein product [Sphagnum balticum]